MKYIFILLFTISVCAQPTKKVLASGVLYNWKIEQMNDNGTVITYFYLTQANSTFFVGMIDVTELKDFIFKLRQFASYPSGIEYDHRSDSFGLNLYQLKTGLYIYDCNENFMKISKANSKLLASEIEKSITLIN